MNKQQAKRAGLKRRERRVRSKICGTAERPRLSVHRTNAHIYAQVIDDVDAKTICTASFSRRIARAMLTPSMPGISISSSSTS